MQPSTHPGPPTSPTADETRWRSVVDRRREADGTFVYAVRTTGVYCRPSCPSRAARRENVTFYDCGPDAEQAGYRACLKCRPAGADPRAEAARAIVSACRRLEEDAPVAVASLATAAGVSPSHFLRLFKRHTGVTPGAYRRRVRAERAREELVAAPSVGSLVFEAGYTSSSRFYADVGQELGMTPSEVRSGEKEVSYVVRPCSLGAVLVGWTARGVCEVGFADTDEAVTADLSSRFPRAVRVGSVPQWVDDLVSGVDRGRAPDVPLDIQGTAFQQRVWQELRRIPAGETRSYAAVATAIGEPGAARAVARACATNAVAVLVPCHRVVRADGGLSGYRWGVARKAALLGREREET